MTRNDRLHIAAMLRLHPDLHECRVEAGPFDPLVVRRGALSIDVRPPLKGAPRNVAVWRGGTLVGFDTCLYLGGRTRAGDTIDAIVACAKRHLWT